MLILAVITFFVLAVINYLIGRKSAMYPPFVFCACWGIALLAIAIFHFYFYPMLPETIVFFTGGAILFSLGSWLATGFSTLQAPQPPRALTGKRVIDCFFWIVALLRSHGKRRILSGRNAKSGH
jgi:hypothetical protein